LRLPTIATDDDRQQRRRVVDGGETAGIVGVAPDDKPGAQPVEGRQLVLSLVAGDDADARAAAAARQVRQTGQRPFRRAAAGQQPPERHRPDVLRSGETDAVDALGHADGVGAPLRCHGGTLREGWRARNRRKVACPAIDRAACVRKYWRNDAGRR
jgi:hypothetical protein